MLKRRGGLKRRKPISRAGRKLDLRRECDRLAREIVMVRDSATCQRCGSQERVQWHHIHTRRTLSLRWDQNNGLALCAGCHYWCHWNPDLFRHWFMDKWPERWKNIEQSIRLAGKRGRIDHQAMRLLLEQELRQIQPG